MTPAELDTAALDWAAAEGWNPGLHDADSFHAADPGGFLLGLLDTQPVATISAVRYGAGFGFIGFYIVRPGFRCQGHGIALWRAGMARLAGRVVGLDGVVAQQDSYRRSGFELAWNNVRHEGVGRGEPRSDPDVAPLASGEDAMSELLDYDAAFFPDDRRGFTRRWVTQSASTTLTIRCDGRLSGYGVIRPCRVGCKIGPLFAESAELADRLLSALTARVPPGSAVQLDVPAANRSALELARAHGMRPVFETARMYRGGAPALPWHRLFGITSFELG